MIYMKKLPMANLFKGDLKLPPLQAFVDNHVQIYPKHSTHGIIPTQFEGVSFF